MAMRRWMILSVLVASLVWVAGCNDAPVDPGLTAFFEADVDEPGPNTVSMQPRENAQKHISIDIHMEEITNGEVYAAAFDINFRPVILAFEGFEAGDFLESSGAQVTYQVAEAQGSPGTLVIGVSLVGDVEGVTGSGTLITLKFKALAADLSPFTFSNQRLLDNTPPAGNPITGIAWYAGRAIVG
jgi:hypothetical protein